MSVSFTFAAPVSAEVPETDAVNPNSEIWNRPASTVAGVFSSTVEKAGACTSKRTDFRDQLLFSEG